MRYLSLSEVLQIHRRLVDQSGGTLGILDLGQLESALRQPRLVFGGEELYPSLAEKAAVLGFTLFTTTLLLMETSEPAMPLWKFSSS
jgi:death on curing protein